MSTISVELRERAKTDYIAKRYGEDKWLYTLADRTDEEMVELPRGKDGKPIHIGETVYGEDGRAWHVEGISLGRWVRCVNGHVVHAMGDAGEWRDLLPEWLTHERPDSLERIADELDEWRFEHMRGLDANDLSDLGLFADRIRRCSEGSGDR